ATVTLQMEFVGEIEQLQRVVQTRTRCASCVQNRLDGLVGVEVPWTGDHAETIPLPPHISTSKDDRSATHIPSRRLSGISQTGCGSTLRVRHGRYRSGILLLSAAPISAGAFRRPHTKT